MFPVGELIHPSDGQSTLGSSRTRRGCPAHDFLSQGGGPALSVPEYGENRSQKPLDLRICGAYSLVAACRLVAGLLGREYTINQMTDDLRRHGLMVRVPKTNTCRQARLGSAE